MSKSGTTSGQSRTGSSAASRTEGTTDDERSFAEIRRTLHDVLRILAIHPWAFFVPFCLVSTAAFVVSLYSARTYTASTTFERRVDPVAVDMSMPNGTASIKRFRSTMAQDLTSLACMTEVVEGLGLADDLPRDENGELTESSIRRRDALARSLAGGLQINASKSGEWVDRIQIQYTGPDPRIGRRFVDQARMAYIRHARRRIDALLIEYRDYFQQQVGEAKAELRRSRREETRLRLDNPLVDPTDPGAINAKLTQLANERRGLLLRRKEHGADLAAQRQLLAALAPHFSMMEADDQALELQAPRSPQAMRLAAEILAANREIENLRTTRGMRMQHPKIAELADRRRWLENELRDVRERDQERLAIVGPPESADASVSGIAQGPAQPWQLDQARTEVQLSAIEEKIREIDRNLDTNTTTTTALELAKQKIYEKQEEFAEVRDRVAKARAKYGDLEGKLATVAPIIEAGDQDRLVHFSAESTARGSSLPVSPKAKTIVLLSLLLGLAAGAGFVILAEIMDNVCRSSAQVARALGLPILDAIDEIVTAQERRRRLVRRAVVAPVLISGGLLITGLSGAMAYLSLRRPSAYEKLRQIPEAAMEFFAGDLDGDSSPLSSSHNVM